MRILVTGAKGQLGGELERALRQGYTDIGNIDAAYGAAELVLTDLAELDITDAKAVEAVVSNGIDVVFNCGAFTNVDGCEKDYDLAYAANALGPANLAASCQRHGAKLVQVSTDYVFPGTEERPRVETDLTGPVSVYGRTKLAGEQQALEGCERTFVVRTAWLYGRGGRNFVSTMLKLGHERDAVTVVDDQLGNPTNAADLAYEMLALAVTDNFGVYHCTNEGTCSWADFAQAIMEEAGLECRVVRCSSEEYRAANPSSANRPRYSSLENAHLAATIGNRMRPWRQALASFLQDGQDA